MHLTVDRCGTPSIRGHEAERDLKCGCQSGEVVKKKKQFEVVTKWLVGISHFYRVNSHLERGGGACLGAGYHPSPTAYRLYILQWCYT